ncbi:hypothetical protein Cantr_05868 [Candida viswanathii]|uniref:Uncharacterized protein n=1 Tax=Candida viswanathii TaxID=5486 RepID=A0A367XR48_9ASCO|nr:hypothetical protein Cantr_05868 [Candida viswanathii]
MTEESTLVEESLKQYVPGVNEPIPMEESMEIISIDTSMETTSTESYLRAVIANRSDDSDDLDDDDSSSTSSSASPHPVK